MSFTSGAFLPFFLLVLLGLRLLPTGKRWMLLLGASWLFYGWHSVPLLGLLLFATGVSYSCGRWMEACGNGKKQKRIFLWGCGCLMGLLYVFKYLDFTVGGLCTLLGMGGNFRGFGLVLPMGISFYVFQNLSYLVDVYRGTIRAEKNPGIFALFVAFFPQLVAGPIERPGDLIPQLRNPAAPDEGMTADSLRLLLRGYAKKIVLADSLAPLVDHAYSNPASAGGLALTAATALFALQIYCDFSGYTDIARGCAGLMGIRLSKNFRSPYAAVTVHDFWRRWHISLTRWFTDYVYIPLGGSRRGKAITVRNTIIVLLLSGLWHGANVTFLLWGGLHGLYLAAETLLDGRRTARHIRLRHGLTLLLVGAAWIFFRADSLTAALLVLKTILTNPAPLQLLSGLGVSVPQALLVVGLLPMLTMVEHLPSIRAGKQGGTILLYVLVVLVTIFCRLLLVSRGGSGAFIYFQF